MGYGTYATIGDIKGVLGITSTTDDTVIRKIAEAASRAIDQYCNRYFYTETATKYFQGSNSPLRLAPDLLSVTTLKTDEDGDATFENTLTVTTDYLLKPFNTFPKTQIILSDDSNYGSFGSGSKRGVEIAGIWGYGDGISATPYVTDTTITEDLTAGESAIDVTAVTNLSAGQVILIGSEQYYIYSISSLTLTVETGVNGTTAATHSSGATIYIYQYPADIRQACIDLGVAMYQNRAKQGLQSERLGDYSYTLAGTSLGKGVVQSILDDNIRSYKRMRF
jgi:hypothetical protein